MCAEPWYDEAFRAEYREVYPHRDLDAARAEIGFLRARGVGGRVLDLCCGFARHTLALRELGIDAFGLDRSAELLARARELPESATLRGRLVRGDARATPFRSGAFDCVLVLFSSFGYFGDEGDRAMLAETARVLRRGGTAVLDLMNPARVRATLVPRSERVIGARTLIEERRLEEDGRRVVKDVRLAGADGAARSWREDVRMYERGEVAAMAERAGLVETDALGSFRGEPHSDASERMLVFLRRR